MNEKNVTYKITGNNNIKAEHTKVFMKNSNIWKAAVFILFVVLITIVNIYHEAWYDEAQAWMIARECSLYEIIFVRPHAEGHPPLWTLILYPMAHNGMDYEVCMRSLMVVISSINTSLILWKSPFPSVVKALLPFTYFFFYQYGAIARPYGLFIMAVLLTAITYKNKDDKPWHHVAALIFLCLTCAFGIIIAGCIATVWVLEIWHGRNIVKFVAGFIHDKRMMPLVVLAVCGLLLIYMIIPDKNTYTGSVSASNGFVLRFIMCLIALLAETTCMQSFESYKSLKKMQFSEVTFVMEIVVGIILWIILIYIARKVKKTLLLIVPYTVLSIFGASVYFFIHHTGVMLIYLVCWFWIVCDDTGICEDGYMKCIYKWLESNKITKQFTDKERHMTGFVIVFAVILSIVISVGWSVAASYNEAKDNYCYAKEATEFLRKHNMYDLNIFVQYDDYTNKKGMKELNTYSKSVAVAMFPYMNDKEIASFMQFRGEKKYSIQKLAEDKDNQSNYKKVRAMGTPDVLIGECDLAPIYGDKVSVNDYAAVKAVTFGYEWKNMKFNQTAFIYVKKELLGRYKLHELSQDEISENAVGAATQRVNVG